jgi:hypothetical protein
MKIRELISATLLAMMLVACGGDDKPAATLIGTAVSREGNAYTDTTTTAIGSYTRAGEVLMSLLKQPEATQAWKDAVLKTVQEMKGVSSKIRDLTPPACASREHTLLLQAITTYDSGADAVIDGMQRSDTVKLSEAEGLLNSAVKLVNQSVDRLNALKC